jgi:DNA-binding CsgD family transcriptional regulator
MAAAAAFLQRATELTQDPARRAERALAAAEASFQAGAFEVAHALMETAQTELVNESQGGRVDLLRGQLAFASASLEAPTLLLRAAHRLETLSPTVARETYLTAWRAANMAGEGAVAVDICHAVRALLPDASEPLPLDTLLDAVASLTIDGRAAAAPRLELAAKALAEISAEDVVRWGSAGAATAASWDIEGWRALNERHVQLMRDVGALAQLPLRLMSTGIADAWVGDFAGAASAIAESESVVAATGSRIGPYALLRLRALQGREVETSTLIADALEQASSGAQAMVAIHAHWAAAVLFNGLGHYEDAVSAARQATSNSFEPWVSMWGLPELVEAASRSGDEASAREAFEHLRETTQPSGGDVALGIEARCLALLSEGTAAEQGYREAIDRLGRTAVRPELARAHLLYGEWLRREGRRVDAREQLRSAYQLFAAIGMEAFAERARRELVATGERVRKRTPETRDELTPQEEQIARLARDGLSNPEIGAQLFISARTVEWHLRKVFAKLGITSRRQLRTALPNDGRLVERA